MNHPYRDHAARFADLLDAGQTVPEGAFTPEPRPPIAVDAPVILCFAPHPDDESITGALPLRLMRELGHRVIVVAVTYGSRPERRLARLEEMRAACGLLGFDLATLAETGLENINPVSRQADPACWKTAVALAASAVAQHRPRTIFLPHAMDQHTTHIGTHHLVMDALACLGHPCLLVETEFWSPMVDPNLMIESGTPDVGDLMAALACHRGEVARNPYHLRLPAWMADNVRRGGELLACQGSSAPPFAFATLYLLSQWVGDHRETTLPQGVQISQDGDLHPIFG